MRQIEQLRETWDVDALVPISDFIDAADRVVVRFIWRGAGHGPDADLEMTGVYTVRKGKVAFWLSSFGNTRRPSKLWASRSGRCRKRTRRSCGAGLRPTTAETWRRSTGSTIMTSSSGPSSSASNPCFAPPRIERLLHGTRRCLRLLPARSKRLHRRGAAVLMVANVDWCGKGSGAQGETPIVAAFWLRAGKVFREETFTDRVEALGAVGLSQQDARAES